MTHPNQELADRLGAEIEATRRHLAGLLALQAELLTPQAQAVEFAAGAVACIEATAGSLGSTYHEVLSKRKYGRLSHTRQACALALWRLGLPYAAIGRELRLAARTVIDSVRSAQAREIVDAKFKAAVAAGAGVQLTQQKPQARGPRLRVAPAERAA